MSRVLITGAAGFIGSHLLEHLLATDHDILTVDNLSGGYVKNYPRNTGKRFTILHEDVANLGLPTSTALKAFSPEYVFHLSADATEGRSQFMPMACSHDNFQSTIALLKACIAAGGLKRFIFTSSMSVYGGQTPPFDEDLPRSPVDIYGINKAASEHAVEVLADVYGFDYVITRPHNIYGPKQRLADPYRNVVAIWMNAILRGKPIYVYGDGEQRRAFSYIDDIIPPFARTMSIPQTSPRIYNLGAERDYSLNQLANAVIEVSGKKSEIIHIADRPREVKHAWATVDRSRCWLGFKDATPLMEGLRRMWTWASTEYPVGVEPSYVGKLEIVNEKTPETWTKRLY